MRSRYDHQGRRASSVLTDRIVYSGVPPGTARRVVAWPGGDVTRSERSYARRLEQAGVEVTARRFDGQIHTFISLGGIIDDANVARSWLGERLREAFTA
jgi:acetyl esterase